MGGSRLRKGSVPRLPRQRLCHSERSEESQRLHWPEILRFAQDDNPGAPQNCAWSFSGTGLSFEQGRGTGA